LARFQRQDLIPQWIDVVVRLHFFPLGKLFKLSLLLRNCLGHLAIFAWFALDSSILPPLGHERRRHCPRSVDHLINDPVQESLLSANENRAKHFVGCLRIGALAQM
jgi:hypothetical protein